MAQLACLVYAEAEGDRLDISRRLDESSHAEIVDCLDDPQRLEAAVKSSRVDAIFVVLGIDAEAVFGVLERLEEPRPLLVFSGPRHQSEWILRAMRLGAREYLPPRPDAETLGALIEHMTLEPSHRGEGRAPLVGVLGAKGGAGATVVATQLAAALQATGREICLVDLNLRFGDAALHYDLTPRYTMADVSKSGNGIDAAFLHSIVDVHKSGVALLAAPQRPEDAELVEPRHVKRALRVLREHYKIVLADLPRAWDDATLHAIDSADALLLVTALNLPSLSQARQQIDLLQRIGLPQSHLRVLANRYTKSDAVGEKDAESFLGHAIDFRIPNHHAAIMESIASGVPLCTASRRHPLHQAFSELAQRTLEWSGLVEPEGGAARGGFARIRNLIQRGRHGAD